jgi:hypothetical protein
MTLSVEVMELQKAFIGRAMRQSSVQARLPMRAEPSKIEPEEWGGNAPRVILQ